MSSINGTNIERMRVNNNEIALAKINGNVVFQKNKLLKTFLGDSKQNTTTGKNLLPFPYSANEKTQNGINFKANNDGSITINGTSTGNAYFALLGYGDISGQVKIEGNYISGGSEDIIINVNYFDGEYHTLATNKSGSTKIDKSVYEKGYIEIYIPQNKNFNNYIIKPILSYEIINYWEPYTGGKPSPNPDYPQEIKSISGVSLKLTGKNLFNKSTTNFIYGFLSNTSNTIVDTDNVKIYFLDCYPNSKYTISKIKGKYFRIATANKKPEIGMEISQLIVNDTEESITITTNSNAKYLFFNIFDISQDTIDEIEMLNSVQIEKGSQATNYEQYKNQTIPINLQENILAKVGDYADELQVYSNGDIKIVKKISKTILDNTAKYEKSSYSTNDYFKGYLSGYGNDIYFEFTKKINTHFQAGEYTQTSQGEMLANRRQLHIQILASRLSENSVTGLQEWLGNNNVTVLRQLINPTTTKIQNIKEELNNFGDYSNIEIETTYS